MDSKIHVPNHQPAIILFCRGTKKNNGNHAMVPGLLSGNPQPVRVRSLFVPTGVAWVLPTTASDSIRGTPWAWNQMVHLRRCPRTMNSKTKTCHLPGNPSMLRFEDALVWRSEVLCFCVSAGIDMEPHHIGVVFNTCRTESDSCGTQAMLNTSEGNRINDRTTRWCSKSLSW